MDMRTSEVSGLTPRAGDRTQTHSAEPPSRTAQQRLAEKYAAEAVDAGKRRLHHSPLFWGGVILFVIAILVYVFTDSLAWMPLRHG